MDGDERGGEASTETSGNVGEGASGGHFAAAWYPDPDARHDQRYFDGAAWTDRVRTAGIERSDLLDGSFVAPSAATTMAAFYPSAAAGPSTGQGSEARNAVGAGLVLAGLGWLTMAGSTRMPWIDGMRIFDLVLDSGRPSATADAVDALQTQVVVSLGLLVLVIIGTTLRYQPGKVVGFCMGGLVGLAVCWRKLDRDATSIRSNLLGAFVVLVHGAVIGFLVRDVLDHVSPYRLEDGVLVFAGGALLLLLGVLVGRRRVLAHR